MLLFTIFFVIGEVSLNRVSSEKISFPKEPQNKLSIRLPNQLKSQNKEDNSEPKLYSNQTAGECDVYCAYSTMYFHRSKMSEYLCHQYLANEILDNLGSENRRMTAPTASRQTSLLEDEGSNGYTIWLNKNNFWDEDENQYSAVPEQEEEGEERENGKYNLFDQNQDTEYETGEITGFALPAPANTVEDLDPPNAAVEHYPFFTSPFSERIPYSKKKEFWPSPRGKGWIGEDIFDIGLSALAFLAFGSFITNLLLTCLLGNRNNTVVVQMSTTTMTSTATGTGTGTGRGIGSGQYAQLGVGTDGDQLANMVLLTLDKLEDATQENNNRKPNCLHYTLCNNNRVNRALDPSQRLWLPLWSFALSWLSGRLQDNRLENLRASVLGLGGASCRQLYPDCD